MKRLDFVYLLIGICLMNVSCKKDTDLMLTPVFEESNKAELKSASYNLDNWMGSINGTKKLTDLSIPGTHDSGARYEDFSGTAICQTLSLSQQLNAGVRFLDIRCRHKDNSFFIHHGVKYQKLNFDDVLNACWSFLSANATETIIMSIKEEHDASNNSRSFEATLRAYISKKASKWYLGSAIPQLNSVRGKIVVFRRFTSGSTLGINASNWSDNTTFTINNGGVSIKVQDNYKVSNNSNKWSKVSSMLNEASNSLPQTMFVNYTSGYKPGWFGIPSIPTVSNYINSKIDSYFSGLSSNRYGVVVMDFANGNRARAIVNTNF